jgi:hypothetical protein
MHIVITLVHGTFSPRARWVQPGSFFRNEVTRRLGDVVSFETFWWSGANNHVARVRASEVLRRQLLDTIARYPSSRHFIVAHSHGGNVARYALREPLLQQRISGLICLGTPFVSCEPRTGIDDPFDSFFALLIGVPVLLVCLIVFAAWRIDGGSLLDETLMATAILAGAVAMLFQLIGPTRALGIVLFPVMVIARAVASWIDRRRDRLVQQLFVPRTSIPTLCVRVSGDEACWALERIDGVAERPFVWLAYVAMGCLFAAAGGAVVAQVAGYATRIFGWTWLTWVSVAGLVTSLAGIAVLLAWALLMLVVSTIRLPVLGWETPFATWSCRIRVHPIDSGSQVYEKKYWLAAPVRRWRNRLRIAHCAVYDDQSVVADVVSWVRMCSGMRQSGIDPNVPWYTV